MAALTPEAVDYLTVIAVGLGQDEPTARAVIDRIASLWPPNEPLNPRALKLLATASIPPTEWLRRGVPLRAAWAIQESAEVGDEHREEDGPDAAFVLNFKNRAQRDQLTKATATATLARDASLHLTPSPDHRGLLTPAAAPATPGAAVASVVTRGATAYLIAAAQLWVCVDDIFPPEAPGIPLAKPARLRLANPAAGPEVLVEPSPDCAVVSRGQPTELIGQFETSFDLGRGKRGGTDGFTRCAVPCAEDQVYVPKQQFCVVRASDPPPGMEWCTGVGKLAGVAWVLAQHPEKKQDDRKERSTWLLLEKGDELVLRPGARDGWVAFCFRGQLGAVELVALGDRH